MGVLLHGRKHGQGSLQHHTAPELLAGPIGGCISGSCSVHTSHEGALLQLEAAVAAVAQQEEGSSTPQVAAEHRPIQAPVLRKWNIDG